MNSLFNFQFNFFPVIWMSHNRHLNEKIHILHKRCLPLVYNDKQSWRLLYKDSSVPVHHRNMQKIATEMQKVKNKSSLDIMNEIIQF